MSPVSAAVLTGGVVAAGKVSQGKGISFQTVMGSMFYAVSLVALNAAAPQLASPLGGLVLLAAIFAYVPSIAKGVGVLK